MRIFINELIKSFCKKSTLGIFLVLAILNGILLWVNENQREEFYTTEQYKAVFAELEGMSIKDAYNKINKQYQKLQIIDSLSMGEDISEELKENPNIDGELLLKDYRNKSYLKYTKDSMTEQELLSDVLAEIESSLNYDNYLKNIDDTAAQMTSISIFADSDTFSYKNIAKTPDDFKHLKGSELKIGPSRGISMATGFVATDLIGLLMIMTIVVTIVTREKELNQIILSKTTYKGRLNLGVSKLFTCLFAALISVIILYAINFLVSYFTYGFGDLTRQIQSVYDFNGSSLKISVLDYFVLFLFAKLIVYCVFAGLIYLVTVCSRSAVQVYGILILSIAAEAVLYYTIPSTSYLCPLKYINILAYSNTKDLFANYMNLNLFGQPINYIVVFLISIIILLIVFSILSVYVFSNQSIIKSRSTRSIISKFRIFKGRNTNLFLQECYKIFIGGKALLILIAFAVAVVITYEPMKEDFKSVDDVYYKQYMLEYEGKYTSQKQQMIDDEEQKFIDAENNISDLSENSDDNFLIIMKYQKLLDSQEAFEQVKEHAEYLKTTENGEFIYDSGYKLLTGDESSGNKDLTLGLTAMAIVVCCLVYIYSIEYQTGSNVLLRTSSKGRGNIFLYKFLIGLIIITAIYILTYAPYFYNVLSAYGTSGINAPAYSIKALSSFNMSIKSYLIMICIGRYVSLILAMLIIFWLSSKLRSLILTFLASTAILILPILMSLLGIKFFDYVLLNPILIGNV